MVLTILQIISEKHYHEQAVSLRVLKVDAVLFKSSETFIALIV
jgi:hypothetical protein